MKIVSIVGARPEFVQEKPVQRALAGRHAEVLVHTGQHYDFAMSQAFFEDLQLPEPAYNLGVGSGSHAEQTARILLALEPLLVSEQPDWVVVRGDTNSTLAGALAAAKLGIPVAHIEAGERSFNRRMPEEINRLAVDHLADLHLCASQTGLAHLAAEGLARTAVWTGDVMLDALLELLPLARRRSRILDRLQLEPKTYALVTLHRAANVDDPARLASVVQALNAVGETVIFPVHPRTRKALDGLPVALAPHVRLLEPVGYLDMLALEDGARLIATDSGGVQREAYDLCVPCLTLRDETEWTETLATGWNRLVGVDPDQVTTAWFAFQPPAAHPPLFGDGTAGERIVAALEAAFEAGREEGHP